MRLITKTLTVYFGWRFFLLISALIVAQFVPFLTAFVPDESYGKDLPYLAYIWGGMDGVIFMFVAHHGYGLAQLPFFPLFPLSIYTLHKLLGIEYLVAGLVISTGSFLVALAALYRLLKLEKSSQLWWLFVAVLFTFPTAFYYSAVYNDALFFMLACLTLLFGRQKKWFLASLFGGLAALTRLTGLSLFFYLGAEYMIALRPTIKITQDIKKIILTFFSALDPRNIFRQRTFWILLVPLAFMSYLYYVQVAFGDWHLFFDGVEVWHRNKVTFPLQTFWRYIKILIIYPRLTFAYVVAAGEALFTLWYLFLIAWSWGKIRFSYWVFFVTALLIPTITGTLQGMPRYGLHLFPFFWAITLWLQGRAPWQKFLYFAVCISLFILYLAAYTRGYFVT